MKTSKFLLGLVINCLIGFAIATVFGLPPAACMIGVNFVGAAMYKINQSGLAMFDGLATEVWLPDVMEDFYPDSSFLNEARDLSSMVENDAINLAEAGADPNVLVDNNVYPITANVAADTAGRLVLKTYDTDSTIVRNATALELAYDQRQLYTKKHQKALLKKLAADAAFAYAPQVNSAYNPVLNKSATPNAILDDIIELQTMYNNLDADPDTRILVLNPNHAAIIAKEDKALYKTFEATPGKVLFGFKIYLFSQMPFYITATGQKAAAGAAFNGGTHSRASFSFLKDEVMKAQGTFKFFSTLNDPAQKGDVFNYQMRALVSKMRDKFAGAIFK